MSATFCSHVETFDMFVNSENGNASDVTSINWLYKPKKNSIFLDSDDRYFSNDTNYIDDTI